ncbi:MAG TPA: triple tyrosine motif-containing protein, partial [Saprospiraceae bacterium]|nr:triple tyrosine motif-containing protein [Saprospiraceae bacterium]
LITQLIFDPLTNGLWFTSGNGMIFFSVSDEEFYHSQFNPLHWKIFEHAANVELAIDKQNRIWFRDNQTQVLGYFDSELNEVNLTLKKIEYGIKQISADEKNRIWIFYWLAGSEIFDPVSGITDSDFFTTHHRRSPVSEQGTYLFIDQQKNHWIASGKGISIYNETNQYYKLHQLFTPDESSKEPLKIKALAQTISSNIWIGTNQGLFNYDLISGNAKKIELNLPVAAITTLCAVDNKLWIGVADQLSCYNTKSGIIEKNLQLKQGIFFIKKGNDDDLWIGLWIHGLYHLDLKTGSLRWFSKNDDNSASLKSNNLITAFLEDESIWIGYNGGFGFSKYSIPNDSWQHYHPQEKDLSNSNAGTITVITKDDVNNLWLGTHGGGIFRFDSKTGTYENFEQLHGLNSNYINSIIPDSNGYLWISTADGMNYMNIEKKTIRALDMGLGFSDNDFAANGINGVNGKLYFFFNNEFVEVDPSAYSPDYNFPKIVVSNFKIFDEEATIPQNKDGIHLSYRENFFSFEFSTVKTQPAKEVMYAYLLEGFDKDWNIKSNHPYASYTNVPHGKYRFKVKATNDQGQWSDELLNLPIFIKPPFWQTWWFIFLTAILLVSAIYMFYHFRIQQMKKIFAVRTKISRDLHDDIGASLSSIHFYSSIAEDEVSKNPVRAQDFLKQINHNSRQIIEDISDIVWANTDKKEKASLAGRIKNYGYDLLSQKNIDCKYLIDENAEKKLTNPEARRNILLIIKEALNNIAKYSEADHAEVRVVLNGSFLLVDITDNGIGFNLDSAKSGNGLGNMQKRSDSLDGNLEIHTGPGKGTAIHCRIPIPNISDR